MKLSRDRRLEKCGKGVGKSNAFCSFHRQMARLEITLEVLSSLSFVGHRVKEVAGLEVLSRAVTGRRKNVNE